MVTPYFHLGILTKGHSFTGSEGHSGKVGPGTTKVKTRHGWGRQISFLAYQERKHEYKQKIYICLYTNKYVYIYIRMNIYKYWYIYIYICVCAYKNKYMCACMYVCMHVCMSLFVGGLSTFYLFFPIFARSTTWWHQVRHYHRGIPKRGCFFTCRSFWFLDPYNGSPHNWVL